MYENHTETNNFPSKVKPSTIPPLEAFTGDIDFPETKKPKTEEPAKLRSQLNPDALAEILQAARISALDFYPIPPKALSFIHGEEPATYGTLGNFSLVIGKAKSKKTFLMVMVLAACIGSMAFQDTIKCELPTEKRRIILFDTEQSKYHVWRRLKTIAALSGVTDLLGIEVYSLRGFTPDERCDLIEHALTLGNIDGTIGIVVIDGIRDLIHDINDPKEATFIATKLMQWTTLADCHIITVLHQNKGDLNARGHVGAELQNKAETVISVTVQKDDKSVSLVEAEMTRDRDFPAFAFKINDLGVPEILKDFKTSGEGEKRQSGLDPYHIQPETHHNVLSKIFKSESHFKRPDLISELKIAWAAFSQSFGDNKARDLISYYSQMGWLKNEGTAGRPGKWIYKPDS